MKEMFSKAMVTCAAIAVFTGSGAAVVNGLSSLIDLKVDTVLVKRELALKEAESASFDTSVAGALVKGTKKLLSN
jgi:hypothetical protein